jgi:protein TonB
MFFLCLAALTLASATSGAQTSQSVPAVPSNPNELMLLASRSNGLTAPDIQPWHLKVAFKLFDAQGNLKSEGVIEEFWVNPTKNKATYTSGSESLTKFETDKGTYTVGGGGQETVSAFKAQRALIEPLPSPQTVSVNKYVSQQPDTGPIRAPCVQQQEADLSFSGPTWCFDPEADELRVIANGSSEDVLLTNSVIFQGRTIAGDVKFSDGELKNIQTDSPAFSAHLVMIEPLTTIDDEAFVPPPGARSASIALPMKLASDSPDTSNPAPTPSKVNISGGLAQGMLIHTAPVEYPPGAKAAGITGTVVLKAVIDTDGRIKELSVISGPAMLQQAAADSLRQWRYKPYLLNGKPVSVSTTVNIAFTLGKKE